MRLRLLPAVALAVLAPAVLVSAPAHAASGHLLIASSYGTDGTASVRLLDLQGKGTTAVGLRLGAASYSPDGTQLAYDAADGPADAQGFYPSAIFVRHADGTVQQVSRADLPYAYSPAWSPDGRTIAYTAGPTDAPNFLHLVAPDGTGDRTLAHTANAAQTSWSPDSQRLVFFTFDNDVKHATKVLVIKASGGKPREIGAKLTHGTPVPNTNRRPQWSPDGKTIAFNVALTKTRYAVAEIHPDGSHAKVVYSPTHGAGGFVWAGRTLVIEEHLTELKHGKDAVVSLSSSGKVKTLFASTKHVYLLAYTSH